MSQTISVTKVIDELNYVAKVTVYGFRLDAIPTLCLLVARLKDDDSMCSSADIVKAIDAGIRTVTAHDPRMHILGEWLFGLNQESRETNLMGRRAQVGQKIARSASSVRQTDQPILVARLAEFFYTSPQGFLRSNFDKTLDEHGDFRCRSVSLLMTLNPEDFRKTATTHSYDLEILHDTEYLLFRYPLEPSWRSYFTRRLDGGRLTLLPVGHPKRPSEEYATYRVDPPYTRGELAHIRMRHRFVPPVDAHLITKPFRGIERSIIIMSESVERLELSVIAPVGDDYQPIWFAHHAFHPAYLPPVYCGRRSQRFTVIISDPPANGVFTIQLNETYSWLAPQIS